MKKIREKFSNLIAWYNGLDSIKKLIVTVIGVVALFGLVKLISMIDLSKKIVDYKNLSAAYVMENYEITNDKQIYVKSNRIITDLLLTTADRYQIQDKKVKLDYYFKYAKYKEYSVSNSRFKRIINNIADSVFSDVDRNTVNMNDIYPIIKNMYVYSAENSMYVIELNTAEPHAIGIKYTSENTFYIFYLE